MVGAQLWENCRIVLMGFLVHHFMIEWCIVL